jgi:C4-dicarboxylate transporter DctM subunit
VNARLAAEPVRASDASIPSCHRPWWHRAEDLGLTLLLAAMIFLPLAEIALRQFSSGIPTAPEILRHLTLLVGMAGGALAAREGRLLALASASTLFRGRAHRVAAEVAAATGAAVSALLCSASARLVLEERAAGGELAYGLPLWIVQLAMPVGFGIITLRQIVRHTHRWRARGRTLLIAIAAGTAGAFVPTGVALGGLLLAALLGTPIFVTIGGAALILFWGHDVPITAVAIEHYGLVTNPALPAIPLFTLAGYLMAEGGASRRLVRVFQALSGWFRGGPAVATALICAFFTAFTGGSGVTILALGGLLMPVLIAARFSERNALGLLTGAGSLGILLPPCLPVILYAIIAKVDINTMFLGGLVPGLLLIALTAGWGIWVSRRATPTVSRFDAAEARRALWAAKWELAMPVVSLAALFSGWATPVEAAAVTAAYAFVVEVWIHRDLHWWRDCPRVMAEAGQLVGGILLILGVALGLTNYLIDAQIPATLAAWSLEHVTSRWMFLLGLNVILIAVGSVVEIFAAIVIMVPLLVPIGVQLGIDPIHLGILFLANMELGFLAPPVGLNLLLSSSRLNRPLIEVARATLPLLAVMFLGVLLITYFPPLTTWLPRLFAP